MGLVDQLADLFVDLFRNLLAVVRASPKSPARGRSAPRLRPNVRGPSRSLIPQRVTIERAMRVTCSMSLEGPVEASPKTISSAASPPSALASRSLNIDARVVARVLAGRKRV
nr:hypothetical protein [Tepidiforma sp.]